MKPTINLDTKTVAQKVNGDIYASHKLLVNSGFEFLFGIYYKEGLVQSTTSTSHEELLEILENLIIRLKSVKGEE
jgi:hypothetical protein